MLDILPDQSPRNKYIGLPEGLARLSLGGHGRVFGYAMTISGASLLLISLLSLWQHNNIMSEAMRSITGMPMHESAMFWMIIPAIAASLILVSGGIAILLVHGSLGEGNVVGLNDRESMVVEYLIRRGGVAEQREIAKELGFTRLQTYRIVLSLRSRNVVEVERAGRTNLVRLRAFGVGRQEERA